MEASKPRGVSLAEIESSGVEKAGAVKRKEGLRGGIRLREPGERGADRGESRESVVRLLDCGEGVYRIEMGERGKERREVRGAIEELLVALERVEEEKQLKVVMIVGMEEWLGSGREEYNAAVEQGLYEEAGEFSLSGDSSDEGRCEGSRVGWERRCAT